MDKFKFLEFIGHQDWLRIGIRDKIIRLFVNPDKYCSQEFIIDYFGLKYFGNLNQYIDWCIYFFGAYEKCEMLLLEKLIARINDPIFIDVGSNVGDYALFMSRICKEVHCFDPYDKAIRRLRQQVELNSLNNIVIHDVGLGHENKLLDFYVPRNNFNEGTGSFLSPNDKDKAICSTKLKIVRGDEYIEKLGLSKVNLIKIDVEGFEKYVLLGLEKTIKKYKPYILLEFSETTVKTFSNMHEFNSLINNYKVSKISSNRPFFLFFNDYSNILSEFRFNDYGHNLLLEPL